MINSGNLTKTALLFCGLMIQVASLVATEVPKLNSFPEVERLWMGLEEGSVRPAAYEQIRADIDAEFKLYASDDEVLVRGQHWATIDPEQLDIEARTLEVEVSKRELQREKDKEDLEQARLRLLIESHDNKRKLRDLQEVSQSQEIPIQLRKRSLEAIEELNQRIASLEQRIKPERLESDKLLKEQEADLRLQRSQKQFIALKKRSELVSRFGGQLRLSKNIIEKIEKKNHKEEKLWVSSGEVIGTIIDESGYEIHVPALSSALLQVPEEELGIFMQDGKTGQLIPGKFFRMDETDTGLEINRTYVFSIPDEAVSAAKESGAQKHLVHVYRMFSQKYRLVQKKDIAFLAPDILQRVGWGGLVHHLWPGSRTIQVGPQTIAVKSPDED